MSGNNLMLVPCIKVEASHNGYFFWLENSTDRRHIGTSVCFYNEDANELRIARWVLQKNAKAWGLRVEKNGVFVIMPEVADLEEVEASSENNEFEQVMLEVRKQLDKAQQAINTVRKLLS